MDLKQKNRAFTAGRDIQGLPMADSELLAYDVLLNLAHSQMLAEVGVLSEAERKALHQGLGVLFQRFQQGFWSLNPELEDVHTNLEVGLTELLNIPSGSKIHSGRSRNDQVATDMRLLVKARLLELGAEMVQLVAELLRTSERERETFLPGFTHYQPAMFTTWGHLLASWASVFSRSLTKLDHLLSVYDFCPLGAAASFGTAWPINRQRTAEFLGFAGPIPNSLDAVTSRLEFECEAAHWIGSWMLQASVIAQDFLLYSQPYYGFLSFPDALVTHSSIMPQKKNLDFAEVIRAKAAFTQGQYASLVGLGRGLPSGYNRDYQQAKYITLDLLREVRQVPEFLTLAVQNMSIDKDRCQKACQIGGMNGVDLADFIAKRGQMGFRTAYKIVQAVLYADPKDNESWRTSIEAKLKEHKSDFSFTERDWEHLNNPGFLIKERKSLGSSHPSETSAFVVSSKKELASLEQKLKLRRNHQNACFNKLWASAGLNLP